MNLNAIKSLISKLFPKNIIIILLGVLICFILVFVLFKKFTTQTPPPLPQTKINQDQKQQIEFESLSFSKDPELPSSIDIPEIENDNLDLNEAQKTATSLGFLQKPKASGGNEGKLTFTWSGQDFFYFYPTERKVSYFTNLPKNSPFLNTGKQPTIESAKGAAQKKLENLGLWDEKFKFLKAFRMSGLGGEVYDLGSDENTNVVEVWYGLQLKNLPVYLANNNDPWIKVRVARDGKVVSFEYKKLPQLNGGSKNYQIIDKNQILKKLSEGAGTLSTFDVRTGAPKTIPQKLVVQMKIDSTQLSYFYSEETKDFLPPIIVSTGTITTKDGFSGSVVVYLPAVNQEN